MTTLVGRRVDVHRNLNTGRWSVTDRYPGSDEYGRVLTQVDRIRIDDPDLIVQPSGLERTRETGTRTVHAYVRGRCAGAERGASFGTMKAVRLDYKPLTESFSDAERPYVYDRPTGLVLVGESDLGPPDGVITRGGTAYALFERD